MDKIKGNLTDLRNSAGLDLAELRHKLQLSRKLILVIVFLALLLDNILLTAVVPIIPDYLLALEEEQDAKDLLGYLWNSTHLNLTHFSDLLYNLTFTDLNHTYQDTPFVPEQAINENSKVGWLFSSKALVQLIANPLVGPVTNRYGSSVPMFAGFVVMLISTLLYAFGQSYSVLFLARSVHGIGSACTAIAGMSLLADTYPDDKERSKAMGLALSGIALGVLIGYPFGGVTYQFVGKMTPFLIIAVLVVLEGGLQLWALSPTLKVQNTIEGTPLHVLLRDPYILIASGAILFPEMAMAMLEPTLPIWLIDTMHPPKWQLGTIFLPDSIGYFVGTTLFGLIAYKFGRWVLTMIALVIMGVCLICIPFSTHITHLIVPHFGLGLSLGIADVSIMPLLAYLVDNRHIAVYGTVYAIAQVSISLGFAIGPSLGGQIVKKIGFPWLMRGMAVANLLYAPFCFLLRDVPTKEENRSILLNENGQPGYSGEETFNYSKLEEE